MAIETPKCISEKRDRPSQEPITEAVEKLAALEQLPESRDDGLFQRAVEGLVALGVPGLVLLVSVAVSGYAGAAALTSALAALGGPSQAH